MTVTVDQKLSQARDLVQNEGLSKVLSLIDTTTTLLLADWLGTNCEAETLPNRLVWRLVRHLTEADRRADPETLGSLQEAAELLVQMERALADDWQRVLNDLFKVLKEKKL